MRVRCLVVFLISGMMSIAGTSGASPEEPGAVNVFAAASTANAVTEVGRIFMEQNVGRFVPSFASSSTLAKQIEHGAPADIFISANPGWMNYLGDRHLIEKETRINLLGNRVVLIVPAESDAGNVKIVPGFDLIGLVGDGRLAMGDPDHVPAGIYGKQALEALDVWKAVEKRVARSKDVRAALALVERGEAPVGVVYATDAAITDRVRVVGVLPEDSHPPIVYPAGVVAGRRSPAVDCFMELLRSDPAKAVFKKYGFTVR